MTDPDPTDPGRSTGQRDPMRDLVTGTDVATLQDALARSLDERDSLAAELAQLRTEMRDPTAADIAIAQLSARVREVETELAAVRSRPVPAAKPGNTGSGLRRILAGLLGRRRS
ncbi:hypothetical protein SAMN05421538_101455 [Paracoccus isoporae]|uniref:DUF3618 domain-containing protein n=1 Tax=Paracoccus isoporae TaxID=591205 RepID=A0A1G6U4B1_9RHOB|nr:hypothetical protein [Paracoccus isoporae]SDD36121.1 hypothetical protein SAMN05421538_101455 [Paracoccus isoporae]